MSQLRELCQKTGLGKHPIHELITLQTPPSPILHLFCPLSQVYIEKAKGEILGVVIVKSGWGSILPTVIIANMMHAGPAEKSVRLNIGDQIMSINGTSLVGLPLNTCRSIIKVTPPSLFFSLDLSLFSTTNSECCAVIRRV